MNQQNNRIEVVFQNELRGRNALHFWIGAIVLGFGIYFWWTGLFSGACVELEAAPERLEASYFARQGMQSSTEGVGSTGAVSMLFDTVCLIGWGSITVLTLMRKGMAAVFERFGLAANGLYAMAAQPREQDPDSRAREGDKATRLPTNRISSSQKIARNHEKRLRELEAKTRDMPVPDPPPAPKTPEEQLADQAKEIEQLKAELLKKKKPAS